jgi:predicted DNA-binding antitoxin AbrB/MazE fold protein
MTVKAIYQDGVFKPASPVNLPDDAWVELEVIRSPQQKRQIASLQGIWKNAMHSEDRGDWVSETLAQIRQESAHKLDRLAQDLGESFSDGQ